MSAPWLTTLLSVAPTTPLMVHEARTSTSAAWRVVCASGTFHVRKAPVGKARDLLAREARAVRAVWSDPKLEAVRTLIPQLHGHDAENATIARRILEPSLPIAAAAGSEESMAAIAEAVGAALAKLHAIGPTIAATRLHDTPRKMPIVWTYPASFRAAGGPREFIEAFAASPAWRGLTRTQAVWSERSDLMHGNAEWACFWLGARDDEVDVQLLGWDCVGIGDGAWDLASWLVDPLARGTERPPAGKELVRSYCSTRGLDAEGAADVVARIHRYIPFALTLEAYRARVGARLGGAPRATALLRLALEAALEPAATAQRLGLEEKEIAVLNRST